MLTFADPEAVARTPAGCTVTVEARDAGLDARLAGIAAQPGCAVNRLPAGMRARQHAAAGYGSQLINVLFAEAPSTALIGAKQIGGGSLQQSARGTLRPVK